MMIYAVARGIVTSRKQNQNIGDVVGATDGMQVYMYKSRKKMAFYSEI